MIDDDFIKVIKIAQQKHKDQVKDIGMEMWQKGVKEGITLALDTLEQLTKAGVDYETAIKALKTERDKL